MRRRLAAVLVAVLLAACGGGSSSPTTPSTPIPTPTPAATPTPPIPAGTTLSFVSGETDQPVAGASVTVGGSSLRTDGGGNVVLPAAAAPSTSLDVVAGGFLDRRSLLRSPASTRFTLWPRTSPTGLTEGYTAVLVYTAAFASVGTPGDTPMERLRPGLPPFILLTDSVRSDAAAVAAHQDAANAIAAATMGQVTYQVVTQRPPSGLVFETRVEPGNSDCGDGTLAFTRFASRSGEISGGLMVFCSAAAARGPTVTHELGHSFGLQHSPDPQELMHGFARPGQNSGFSAREALSMRLMLQRPAGNRFPDDDQAVVLAGERTRTIICYGRR